MTYNYPEIRKFEKPYVERLEAVFNTSVDKDTWWETLSIILDWEDEEENGSKEWQQQRAEQHRNAIQYIAYALRDDLDGSWHLHPYPQPVTRRLREIWPLAKYFYHMDDPNGFLGPASGELVYVVRAICAARVLGNTDFDDVFPLLCRGQWWADTYDTTVPDDDAFRAWLDAGEFEWMFAHRGTKEEYETRSQFIDHAAALARNRH